MQFLAILRKQISIIAQLYMHVESVGKYTWTTVL